MSRTYINILRCIPTYYIIGAMPKVPRRDSVYTYIGNRLKQARLSMGEKVTLKDVAKHTGLNYSTISRYESGERPIYANDLYLLCRFYGISMSAVFPADARKASRRMPGAGGAPYNINTPVRLGDIDNIRVALRKSLDCPADIKNAAWSFIVLGTDITINARPAKGDAAQSDKNGRKRDGQKP